MELIEEIVSHFIGYVVPFVELAGAVVVTVGAIRLLWSYARAGFPQVPARVARLRMQLGQSLVMGLEFQVAADILRTAIAPTWNDILELGALILLRAALNYFLERELVALDHEWHVAHEEGQAA